MTATEEQTPIPVSFWLDPSKMDIPEEDIDHNPSDADVANQWAPTFAALGFEIHEALSKCMNTFSALLNKQMVTIEDVYRHLVATQQLMESGEVVSDPEKNKTTARQQKKSAYLAASAEWHDACKQRKVAISAWDEYVKSKKEAMNAIKTS